MECGFNDGNAKDENTIELIKEEGLRELGESLVGGAPVSKVLLMKSVQMGIVLV